MGDSVCAILMEHDVLDGKLSEKDFGKISRAYHQYTFAANALWESNLDTHLKRSLDLLLYENAFKKALVLKIDLEYYRTRLQNLISSHHKKLARENEIYKVIKKNGLGTRLY